MASPELRRAPLPVELTSFVGRREQIAELGQLLADHRLVTISGPGGCGKTRLAIEALMVATDRGEDGTGWVDLAAVADLSRVAEAVAAALGVLVGAATDPTTALVGGLRDRRIVIGMDNCEHLVDACGDVVDSLLRACPGVSVLATSREPLGVAGETVWRVPAMAEDEVVILFEERARAARSDFALDAAGEHSVRTISRRLDGIPLAVELAAAWIRILTPAQIEVALDDRFRLLVGGPRRGIRRQQTLLASVEWSYGLLRDDPRTLLRRTAVFPTWFDLPAAEAICADLALGPSDVLPALRRLVDASIVSVEEQDGLARYRLPETIREFASARLAVAGETTSLRDRHLSHFLMVAEHGAAELDDGDQDVVLRRLEGEHDSFRAALEWGLGGPDPEPGRRLAAALVRLWFLHGHAREGIEAVQRGVDLAPDDESNLQAELLGGIALLSITVGRMALNVESSRRAIEIATRNGDDRTLARASAYAAYVPFYSDYDRADELAQAALRHGAAAGENFPVDFGLLLRAVSLANRDRYDEVIPIADELLASSAPRNDRFCAAFSRNVLVYTAAHTGDVRRAVELGQDAVRFAQPLGDFFTTSTVTSDLAWAQGLAGNVNEALRLTDRLTRAIEGAEVDVIALRVTVGRLHLWAGDLDLAVEWLRQAVGFTDPGEDNWTAMRALPSLASALRRLGHVDDAGAAAEAGLAMARRLGTPHVQAESLDELARIAVLDDPVRAEAIHQEAVAIRVAHGLRTHLADSLDGLALVAVAREEPVDAARLLAASETARAVIGYPRRPVDLPLHTSTDGSLRKALGDVAYDQARQEGGRLALDDAVAYVTRARGRRRRPATGWGSLTPTEHDVIALVVEGLTNPQIAERLFVSRATVKTHLAHVFTKLGTSNRAELAAVVTRRGSVDGGR